MPANLGIRENTSFQYGCDVVGKKEPSARSRLRSDAAHYLNTILGISAKYLSATFNPIQFSQLIQDVDHIYGLSDEQEIIKAFSSTYIKFIERLYQSQRPYCGTLHNFIAHESNHAAKMIWGDSRDVLDDLKLESIDCMVTSPPYYNARDYSQWDNLNAYLDEMQTIIAKCYAVLKNHRVFVFNVGDIFDNDHLQTRSTWGKRRIPLSAYFIKIFEEIGFTFVDDIIWDKGEVQSERHKNGNRPYPFYQYPMNCYEHLLVFHKHRVDPYRYPCPICGTLNVNGNAHSGIGIKSWECKNLKCKERSAANRGKRFSLKTIMTQGNQQEANTINKEYIYSWRRDVKKISPIIKINAKKENRLGHTAPFPLEIPEYAVRMFSYPNEIVLDPFAGLGTSQIVALQNKRIGLGIEKDIGNKKYHTRYNKKYNLDTTSYRWSQNGPHGRHFPVEARTDRILSTYSTS